MLVIFDSGIKTKNSCENWKVCINTDMPSRPRLPRHIVQNVKHFPLFATAFPPTLFFNHTPRYSRSFSQSAVKEICPRSTAKHFSEHADTLKCAKNSETVFVKIFR